MNYNSKTHNTLEQGYDFNVIDNWGKKYHFKIASFAVPSGLLSEAIEVVEESMENFPRTVHVLSKFNENVEKAEMVLKTKIKNTINRRHLFLENGQLQVTKDEILRGTISWSDNFSDKIVSLTWMNQNSRLI